MDTTLRIGISACFFHADPKRAIFKGKTLVYLEQSLAQWILGQGVLAYMIPSIGTGESLDAFVRDLDGLILQGGSDVAPQTYGEQALKPEWGGDYVRDQYEIELFKQFHALAKPIFGVCRGAQLINVALGGTLYQDITTQVPGSLVHRDWEIYDQNFHNISIEKNSLLGKITGGAQSGKVNSVHHQGLKDLGKGLVVEAKSEKDGIIEAVKLDSDRSFVYAVQWHPEFQDMNDKTLFDATPLLTHFLGEASRVKSNPKR